METIVANVYIQAGALGILILLLAYLVIRISNQRDKLATSYFEYLIEQNKYFQQIISEIYKKSNNDN